MHTSAHVDPRPAPLPLAPELFREAMSHLAAALTVVTTRDAQGRYRGFTASSVASASQEPPLLLVGVSNGSSCLSAILECESFVVNVLGEQHREVAAAFARRDVDRFAGLEFGDWSTGGPPRLIGAKAAYLCRNAGRLPVGDHQLVLGELTGLFTDECAGQAEPGPLLWHRRDYATAYR
jgi:flavin reductase ActVB